MVMRADKRIQWLREQVAEQRAWITKCGGDLTGYIANYGDPGVPPINPKTGRKRIFVLKLEDDRLFRPRVNAGLLTRAAMEDWPDGVDWEHGEQCFYAPHSGNGGTAIYEADQNHLDVLERELATLEANRGIARHRRR
jgi:hypothetical protein